MRRFAPIALWLAAALVSAAQPTSPATLPVRPRPAVEHVVIVIVDGLRPDLAALADAPTIRAMMRGGAYSLWAKTTNVAITLPSCTSMLTGVRPEKHRVSWNGAQPIAQQSYPAVPTVLEMATRAGYVTAMVAGKSKFAALAKPGTVTYISVPSTAATTDEVVAAEAVKVIETHRPGLMCIHFPGVDAAGHSKGWGSPEQLAQISKVDGQLALVFAALEQAGIRGSTFVVLSADHGGALKTHGANDARSAHIPWIASGPGVRSMYDLTRQPGLEVHTEDTCATACWLLGLPQQSYFDGKPITEAFEPLVSP